VGIRTLSRNTCSGSDDVWTYSPVAVYLITVIVVPTLSASVECVTEITLKLTLLLNSTEGLARLTVHCPVLLVTQVTAEQVLQQP
jgi:hypothetical protein